MHLDEEQLQRVLHGQLPARAARSGRDHLAECGDCRERFVAAERDEKEVLALLRPVDHPVPAIDPDALVARPSWTRSVLTRWAAAILLFLGAAGAA
jgi:predicted anti-sigma-YlaC factor YlaD